MKKLIVALMAFTVVFTIAACAKENKPGSSPSPSASAPATTSPSPGGAPAAPASAAKELKITATNWKFDQAEYKVKAGETYKVTLSSTEGAHGFQTTGLNLNVGTNKTVEYKFEKAGTYEIQCNVPCGNGHMTMKAKIVVEA
ncbi:cupredoxin domain-containing protein [Paenibacillus koleovorans]|uniref:cupredoxin domain-containing protein n=1 Tax=Paenibacillus koleovorans TaxID=121608 RepID=UPI000FDA20F2|nr:cupredoxin domain-containing protein [Paenibacillus koleovorans]